jgi:hypothetical protein
MVPWRSRARGKSLRSANRRPRLRGCNVSKLSGQRLPFNRHPGGQIAFDQTKSWGLGQKAPLTPEYQAVLEASIADQANGGQGNWNSGARCLPRPDAAVECVQNLPTQRRPTAVLARGCPGVTRLTKIGNELHFKGAGDILLPTRKNQPPPDLRYFDQTKR